MTSVAVTGWAIASPVGSDLQAFWQHLCQGPTRVLPYRSEPDFPGFACLTAPLPPEDRTVDPALGHRATTLAATLGRRALAFAGLDETPEGLGLALGSHWGEGDFLSLPRRSAPPPLLPTLARALGVTGPMVNTPVACTAGNMAIAWAVERIRSGDAPCMLAGGLDVIGPMAAGFYEFVGTLSESLPRPFSEDRDGFLLSEGGAMFLLEPVEQARAAGRPILAEIRGVGFGHDASHPTRPADDGRGLRRAMEHALAEAGLAPQAIGYLNAHSPGTLANDPGEAAAIRSVFGPQGVPVGSTKAALGHAQGGANALEAVACILALAHGEAPPTLNLDFPDPSLGLDLIAGSCRSLKAEATLSLASSMGGASSAIVFTPGDAWA